MYLVPMLVCDDVQESIRFYTEVLGFKVDGRLDHVGRSGWASLNNGRSSLMLTSAHSAAEFRDATGRHPQALYYFYPDDVVALRDSVIAKGYACSELAVRFYRMKEFEMTDPSGHVLVFGQDTDEPPTPE